MVAQKVIGEISFLWLAVEKEPGTNNRRGYVEKNAIALPSKAEPKN